MKYEIIIFSILLGLITYLYLEIKNLKETIIMINENIDERFNYQTQINEILKNK